jgi:hypothetical protein
MTSTPATPNRKPHFVIEGRELGYPTHFRQGSSMAGLFLVSAGVARELIADSGFRIATVAPGKAVFTLTCVHYTDTDCGAYEEIAMGFFVEPFAASARVPYLSPCFDIVRGQVASYTWKLQVTTTLSQQAGIEMWGFPKTVEAIDYRVDSGQATVRLEMEGRSVLRFSIPARGSRNPPPIVSPVYSIFRGAPHVGLLSQSYAQVGYTRRGAVLELGDHSLSGVLRRLGATGRPLISTWAGKLAFEMSAPRPL